MIPGFIRTKRCPRCGGNIYVDSDRFGWYEQCLQCGVTLYLDTVIEARDKIGEETEFQVLDSSELSPLPRRKRGMEVIAPGRGIICI
jgi:hypothetical protein